MTQQQFAHKAQLATTSIARYETNSTPSAKVLSKFSDMARKANLPFFVAIFDRQVLPDPQMFEKQELCGMLSKVKAGLGSSPEDTPTYQKTKILFALDLVSNTKLSEIETLMSQLVPVTTLEEAINRAAGDFLRDQEELGPRATLDEHRSGVVGKRKGSVRTRSSD